MKQHHRTVWLSDIHLGCKDCKADLLLDFLSHNTMDTLYLVGDIVDFWALKQRFLWPESHNELLQALYRKSLDGTTVIYLPGNHDEIIKPYANMLFGKIAIKKHAIHTTADNKKLLVVHGDDYDGDVCLGKWQAWLGDKLYDVLLFLNRQLNYYRRMRGFHYWSLAAYIKKRIKKANQAISRYRNATLREAAKRGLDGVVCGHIHHPEIVKQNGLIYCNDGDWIESCSALTESQSGELSLIYWTVMQAELALVKIAS